MTTPDTQYGGATVHPLSAQFDMLRPWAPGETAKITVALASIDAPAEQIRTLRPPLPQVPFMPPRLGYLHEVVDVDTCVNLSRDPAARDDFSGSPAGYSGSSIPSMGVW